MKTKKYKITEETTNVYGRILHRIEALRDFNDVKKGDKGGFIEKEDNLSQNGNCWIYNDAKVCSLAKVYDEAKVYDNAVVSSNAKVYGNAVVCGNARIYNNAKVYDNALIFGNAEVCDNAMVYGNAEIRGNAIVANDSDYIVFKNWWSSGRYFTWTRSNNMWKVGCFYGTGEELIAKAYKDSELSGKEYEKVVKYAETILKDTYDKCYRYIL